MRAIRAKMYTSVFAGLKSRQDSVSSIEDGFFYGSDGLEDDFGFLTHKH